MPTNGFSRCKPFAMRCVQVIKTFTLPAATPQPVEEDNMQSIKISIMVLLLVTLMSTAALAMRHGPAFGHEGKRAEHLAQLKEALDLNPDQIAEIDKILAESKEKTKILRAENHRNHLALRDIFATDNIDEEQVKALTGEQAELHANMMREKHSTRARINQLLTPEQQTKHQELRQQRMAKRDRSE